MCYEPGMLGSYRDARGAHRRGSWRTVTVVCVAVFAPLFASAACGSTRSNFADDINGATPDDAGDGSPGSLEPSDACLGMKCRVPACDAGTTTTLRGTAYAPNGTLPLYNVIAFVPEFGLAPLADGLTCDKCGTVSGNPIASAVSDSSGHFELKGVPAGKDIPFVLQVGKWRRQVTIPYVAPCVVNDLSDPNLTRLPKDHTEGDIPHIAVTTGSCDTIGCVLPKMGISPSEFGVAADYAQKRVIFYKGADEANTYPFEGAEPAQKLWGDLPTLSKFDTAIFSCECDEYPETKPDPDRTVVSQYLDHGGRVFTTDFGYTWIAGSLRGTMTAPPAPLPSIMGAFRGGAPPANPGTYSIDTTFPKGIALDQWLHVVDSTAVPGEIDLNHVFRNFDRADSALAQRWVYGSSEDKVFTFTTPFSSPKADRCGKAIYLDMHVGNTASDVSHQPSLGKPFPTSCGTAPLTAQEKMLVFFLMDLASCIQDDAAVVVPPK